MQTSWREALLVEQAERRAAGLWRRRRIVSTPQSVNIAIANEESAKQSRINFSSNDYLGLANHMRLINAAAAASERWGVGSGGSHLVSGHYRPHQALEATLADFVGAEAALLFSSGYMANLALATSFVGKGDLILQDKLNHASLIDGARLSYAQYQRYAHLDLAQVDRLLKSKAHKRCLLMTDSVFSMDGDQAPLLKLERLARAHNALLIVDDAHGFGVLGDNGRGSLNACGVAPQGNVLMMATLGKALGSYGAFVAGDAVFIEHLIQTARTYTYTTALPAMLAVASHEALNLLQEEGQQLQEKLQQNIGYFKSRAETLGLRLMPSNTAIQPWLIGDATAACAAASALANAGLDAVAIRPPTVPKGSARLRIALSAEHSLDNIDTLLAAMQKVSIGKS